MKELEIKLFGRVQGVSLRHRISLMAKRLGLNGFVENKEDGSVYCLVQGQEDALNELLTWCQKSEFPTKLTGMNFEWRENFSKKFKDFKVVFNKNFLSDETSSLITLGKRIFNVDNLNIPRHVVIIPDVNRRWARSQGWLAYVGHRKAATFEKIIEHFSNCKSLGIEYLSVWGFSTENWNRDNREITEIFKLIENLIPQLTALMHKEEIRFRHLGRKDRLPKSLLDKFKDLEESTKTYGKLNFQFCLDYGGRSSLVEAVNKIIEEGLSNISEEDIAKHLDSAGIPDPDLIIRTSGEKRTSGIMPFESVYAELYFTNVLFPDFDTIEFQRAILDYSARTRRFGGTASLDLKNIKPEVLIDPDL